MDTNGDGIIDDLLATPKKCGRKSLGLTKQEMKARREELRKKRRAKKRLEEKRDTLEDLVWLIVDTHTKLQQEAYGNNHDPDYAEAEINYKMDEFIDMLAQDEKLMIKAEKAPLSGYNGERLRRPRG